MIAVEFLLVATVMCFALAALAWIADRGEA